MAAETILQIGTVGEALAMIEDALAAVSEDDLSICELLRIRGDALLKGTGGRTSATKDAEASYRRAIALAQGQGAKLLELRAATSLARLLRTHGRSTEAHELLAPIYAAFTEGFDVRDLIDARVLLAETAA